MKLKSASIVIVALGILALGWSGLVFAQSVPQGQGPAIGNVQYQAQGPSSFRSLTGVQNFLINVVIRWLQIFFWIIVVLLIIITAYRYLTAQGNEEKVKEANKSLRYLVIGIVVALLATAIPALVTNFIGQ